MAVQSRRDGVDDWAPRGVMRGLLWWPPVALLLAVVLPDGELGWIAVAGLALAAAGAACALAGRRGTAAADRTGAGTIADPAPSDAPEPIPPHLRPAA